LNASLYLHLYIYPSGTLDASELSKVLSTFHKHSVPFYTGEMYESSFLHYDVNWQLSEMSDSALFGLETQIKTHVQKSDISSTGSIPSYEINVAIVDDYLGGIAEREYPGETVIFVIAPRKASIFGETNRRRHYHYKGDYNGAVNTGLDCVSNWVGKGKYLVADLAAGPCTWGVESQVSGPTLPYVGDGTQGPSSIGEALGNTLSSLVPLSFSENNNDDKNNKEDGEEESDEDIFDRGSVFDEKLSRMFLTAQVSSMLNKAVKYLLCPALGREDEAFAAYPTSARHLAVTPARKCKKKRTIFFFVHELIQ
jgi:hypothetical protein